MGCSYSSYKRYCRRQCGSRKKDKEQHEKDLLTAKAIQKESAVNDALTAENHYLNDLNEILKEELINRVSGDDENE